MLGRRGYINIVEHIGTPFLQNLTYPLSQVDVVNYELILITHFTFKLYYNTSSYLLRRFIKAFDNQKMFYELEEMIFQIMFQTANIIL